MRWGNFLGPPHFHWCFGTSSPELSIDELRCCFFGVVLGDEGAAAVAGGDGLMGG